MANNTDTIVSGWFSASSERGSIDILWSCCLTVVLCCWVSVIPNVGAPTDKWYHLLWDKFSLACIATLGPDLIFGIALGQFSSAKRSVKLFKERPPLQLNLKWTLRYAFFVDMGGIHLKSPDFPEGFPINAEQLHYLAIHDHVDFPNMEDMCISERNSADTLSRIITVFQAFWFTVSEIERLALRLPMTTLELTAISFSMMMFATSITWYHKPSISQPRYIHTRNGQTIQAIRDWAQRHTYPSLPSHWQRTPLEFIGDNYFTIDIHWGYYTRVAEMLHIPMFSRPIICRPWDRFRSDTWVLPDFHYSTVSSFLLLGFSVLFIAAWNFHFPSKEEQILWRACSIYHAFFSVFGGVYFWIEMFRTKKRVPRSFHGSSHQPEPRSQTRHQHGVEQQIGQQSQSANPGSLLARMRLLSLRDIFPAQDPEIGISFYVFVPVSAICIFYVFCRAFIYVEDFASLRSQPSGVYIGVNKFIPFLGS